KALAQVRGSVPLLAISFLRTAVFMGYLAYLAVYYDDRFRLDPALFSLVWTLSGASFFVSNLLTGRITNAEKSTV
ncbi:MFS transporter, partial [Streptomyces sp. SID7982]|nr:MFS transporter [Streptomyces sp. SID7982]